MSNFLNRMSKICKTNEKLRKLAIENMSREDSVKVIRSQNSNVSQRLKSAIVSVHAVDVKGGYRYEAELTNGERIVLRKKATSLYKNVFLFGSPVRQVNKDTWLDFFAMGANPSSMHVKYCNGLTATYPVNSIAAS